MWNKTVLFGAVCNTVMAFAFVAATKLTTAANAIVLQFTEPVFVILLMWLIFHKKPGRDAVFACAGVFAGILCFFYTSLDAGAMAGNLLAILSGLAYALVMMQKKFRGADFESSLLVSCALSAAIGIPFYGQESEMSLHIWFFVLLLGVPALLNIVAPELCLKYMLAHSIDQLLSNIIYLIYPTTFERPVPPKKGLTGFVIGTVYGANHRFLNCAPSVHCSVSFLFAFAALAAPMLPLWLRLVIVVWSLAIVASTMLVKQHMVIDAVTALPAAAVCWLLAGLVNFSSLAAKFS